MFNWLKNLLGTWEEEGYRKMHMYVESHLTGAKYTEDAYVVKEKSSWTGDKRYRVEKKNGRTSSKFSGRHAEEMYKELENNYATEI